MTHRAALLGAMVVLIAGPAAAQDGRRAAQDARRVLEAAAETMGVTEMTSIRYAGTGWVGGVGQNHAPDEDWPRFELASYTRTIDFAANASTEEMVIRQGPYPARGGGAPISGERRRTQLLSGTRPSAAEEPT